MARKTAAEAESNSVTCLVASWSMGDYCWAFIWSGVLAGVLIFIFRLVRSWVTRVDESTAARERGDGTSIYDILKKGRHNRHILTSLFWPRWTYTTLRQRQRDIEGKPLPLKPDDALRGAARADARAASTENSEAGTVRTVTDEEELEGGILNNTRYFRASHPEKAKEEHAKAVEAHAEGVKAFWTAWSSACDNAWGMEFLPAGGDNSNSTLAINTEYELCCNSAQTSSEDCNGRFHGGYIDSCKVIRLVSSLAPYNMGVLVWALCYQSTRMQAEVDCWKQHWWLPSVFIIMSTTLHIISFSVAIMGKFALNAILDQNQCKEMLDMFGEWSIPLMEFSMCFGTWTWASAFVHFIALHMPNKKWLFLLFFFGWVAAFIVAHSLFIVVQVGVVFSRDNISAAEAEEKRNT